MMDKYQRELLLDNREDKRYRCYCISVKSNRDIGYYVDCETDTFILQQEEDIHSTKYTFGIYDNSLITKCFSLKNNKWQELEKSQPNLFSCVLDFDDRVEKIKICFKDDMADDYVFSIVYQEADKEAYYAKQEQQKKDSLLKAAKISHSTGNDLVNIYFQPCCDEYERTEITLYKDSQMLAKYKVDDGVFFKAITGLAYGTYEYVVKQFGANNKLLLETNKIKFTLSRPNYGGRPPL